MKFPTSSRGCCPSALISLAILWLMLSSASAALSTLTWTNQLLTISNSALPGGSLPVWYPEAFCRTGAHTQMWDKTTWKQKNELLSRSSDGTKLELRTLVAGQVEVLHHLRSVSDGIDIVFELTNKGELIDIQWFEPACIRVARFTGADQKGYTARSFIFTDRGLTLLSDTRRTEDALYRGGQVFIPPSVRAEDANPRPLSLDHPINGLIGCFSADNRYILATASDRTHQLFEGVYVCLHSDPRLDGLGAGEKKTIHSKIYLIKNDPKDLLRRYRHDFKLSKRPPVW